MLSYANRRRFWLQVLLLVAITCLFTFPRLLSLGTTNIVTNTYQMGAQRFWSGELPYKAPHPGADVYKYSPFFAMIYAPIASLSPKVHVALWALLNIFVFWLGVSMWFNFTKHQSKWLWLALLACSMELNGPILYQQINALLIGLVLIALAYYRDSRYFRAGLVIALAANLKVLPVIFALGLLMQFRPRYLRGLVGGSLVVFLIPAMALGLKQNFLYHMEWFSILLADVNHPGILDIATVVGALGFPETGSMLRLAIMFLSISLMCVIAFNKEQIPWPTWIALGCTALLLVNPRTESPTFVLVAPAYLFLTLPILKLPSGWAKSLAFIILYAGVFFITFCYNDLWPEWLWNPHQTTNVSKTFGTLALWVMAMFILARETLEYTRVKRLIAFLTPRAQ